MPKPQDILPCPGIPVSRSSGRKPATYQIRLVTPMFGGGAEAGEPDHTLPIRGTSIRGQLQFWWRATCGTLLATREELFQRQAEIWGTTDQASPVRVEVRDPQHASMRPCAKYEWNKQAKGGKGAWKLSWEQPFRGTALPYALFPFQGKPPEGEPHDARPAKSPAHFIESASFVLHMHVPDLLRQDVETAVKAWIVFGGLGARTRRGCGSLFCDPISPPSSSQLDEWWHSNLFPRSTAIRDWPTLSSAMLVGPGERQDPVAAWCEVIEHYQYFRQGVDFARSARTQEKGPGRSRFPEPEAIRKATGCRLPKHAPLENIPDDAFPRAELGLPIVFHFKDQRHGRDQRSGDPPDTELYPSAANGEKRERMASPLILKPLALANGRAVPMVMRLLGPSLGGVELRQGKNTVPLPASTVIRHPKLARYENSPLAAAPSGSALDAFVAFLRQSEHGYRELRL